MVKAARADCQTREGQRVDKEVSVQEGMLIPMPVSSVDQEALPDAGLILALLKLQESTGRTSLHVSSTSGLTVL